MSHVCPRAEFPSVMDPDAVAVGRAYAEALLHSLSGDADAASVGEQLTELGRLIRQTEGSVAFLNNPLIRSPERRAMVERVFGAYVSRPVAALLGVLADNCRLAILPAVAEQYARLLDERLGRVGVSVRSACPLREQQVAYLREVLSKKLGAAPRLSLAVDPSLVGGLLVQAGDTVYDVSVAGALRRFGESLENKE